MSELNGPEDECYLLPTSFGQERLWLLDRIGAGNAYHITGALRLEGELDPDAVGKAFAALAQRHEILRTTIEFGLDGALSQAIHPHMDIPLYRFDVSVAEGTDVAVADGTGDPAVKALADRLGEPFDLAAGPLLRAVLVRLRGEPAWLLGVAMHHIVSDGWSVGVLLAELAALYRAEAAGTPADLPELPIQYGDFAAWQRERLEQADPGLLAYWRETLAGARPVEAATRGRRLPQGSPAAGTVPIEVPQPVAEAVRALAREEAATPFTVLFAAYAAVLARWTEQDDVVVGTPVAGRDRQELEGLIGFFVNTLPLRIAVDWRAGFRGLVRRARQACLGAIAHQEVPFERIVELSGVERVPGRPPLVGALIALQNTPAPAWRVPGVRATPVELPIEEAQVEVSLHLAERADGALAGQLIHSLEAWSGADATLLAQAWQTLLAAAVADPDRAVGLLPLGPPGHPSDAAHYGPPVAVGCVHRRIEAAAEAHAHRTALAIADGNGDGDISYRELDDRAEKLARRLRIAGAGPEQLVAVCMPRSAAQIVSLVAVLKSGAAYLPLDPSHPRTRIERVLADAAPVAVLADSTTAASGLFDGLCDRGTPAVLVVDGPAGDAPGSDDDSRRSGHGGSLAYTIHTSGSTGTPKGAMNTHDAVVNRVLWMQRCFPLAPGETVLHKTPLGFDVSAWEWMWPLAVGGRVAIAEPGRHRDPGYVARLIVEQSVSVCHFVPSMLHAFLAEPAAARCGGVLRRVLCSGEELSPLLARRFFEVLPGVELYNLYGPAEAAIDVTWHRVVAADGERPRIPIGRPLPGVGLRVLDPRGEPVPDGVPGELYIAGTAVGRGYLGRPALTAERFVPDALADDGSRLYRTGDQVRRLPDGELEFLGRYDQQVKLRGIRIEPGEIEAALGEHPLVEHAAVVAVGGDGADRRLVAYVVGAAGSPDPAELRTFLLGRLPQALVPDAFVVLPELPVTANGKLDRAALPDPRAGRPAAALTEPPRTAAEQVLAQMWSDVLQLPDVGIRDNFYALGGNSLRAVAIFQRAQAAGLPLSLELMLGDHTVEQLAARLGEDSGQALRGIGRSPA